MTRLQLRLAGAAGGAALTVLVAGLLLGDALPRPAAGLPDPGPLPGWGLPVLRLTADLAGFAVVGLTLATAFLLPGLRAVRTVRLLALAWGAAVGGQVVLTLADFLGLPLADALDLSMLRSFVTTTATGRALAVQLLLVLLLAAAAAAAATTRGATALLLVALAALAPPALAGHAAAAGSHDLATASLLVHVLGASLWVGGVAALAWAAMAGAEGLALAAPRFSRLASWCLVAVGLSGLVSAALGLGRLSALVDSRYGLLVIGKASALVGLGLLGDLHRRRTVRALALGPDRGVVRAFARLAAAELVLMTATVGLAVALSRTRQPAPVDAVGDAASRQLGYPLPAAPTVQRLVLGWFPDGFALTFVLLAGALYATGALALRRRGDAWPLGRTFAWYGGLALFAWVTLGGLGRYSAVLFSAHMGAHMLLSMVVPIGLVLGAPVTLALRTLPGGRVSGATGPRQLLLGVLHSPPVRLLTSPVVALALFVGSLYVLYFTGLFGLLMDSHLGHVGMEFHFLAVGSLFFYVLIGIDPSPRRLPPLGSIGVIFLAMALHAFFSIAVMSTDTVLARDYFTSLARPYRTDLLADQHLGGGLGWALGELPMLLVLIAVFVQWSRADAREAGRGDRAAERTDRARAAGEQVEDELADYNAYLASLEARDR